MLDTIVAISTSLGVGAISIIRVSGENSIKIVNKIFSKNILNVKSHTIHYGYILENNKKIDEVLVSIMKSPKTFTTEDIVEINCHGGISTTKKVLELVIENGARLAEPGEFTKRAFLNGRIDLIEADGIMNLISSKTEKARELSINQLSGHVSKLVKDLRTDIVNIISNIEVNIDYPEYDDIEVLTTTTIKPKIDKIEMKMKKILKESESGKLINNGIKVGIIGRPNVGKSSLLNILLGENKAIVTDIEGTTRDIVEGSINLDGVLFNIIDTAGIRETENKVEKIGVLKSLDIIEKADLLILILNSNEKLNEEDKKLIKDIENKNHIILLNKTDLGSKIDLENAKNNIIKTSFKENIGIDELKEKMKDIYNIGKLETENINYLTDSRSIALLKKSLKYINNSISNIEHNESIDIVEIDLKNAWSVLGEIIGETYKDELIDEMFSKFCLGK